jgi:aspartate/methionine/tyrosine aminotransferase
MSSSSPSAVAEAAAGAPPWPALRASGLWELLSERGRRAVLPEGIRTWVERARAADVDATIGVLAGTERELSAALGPGGGLHRPAEGPDGEGGRRSVFYLSHLRAQFPSLTPLEVFPYTPVAGTRSFREAWRDWLLRKAAQVAEPERVRRLTALPIATPGVSGALFCAGHLFLDPGEALVAADKRWDGYDTSFGVVLGARLVAHRLFTPAGRLDQEALLRVLRGVAERQAKVTAVLNFPNNPTGYMPAAGEVEELRAGICRLLDEVRKPLVLLFDDAYEGYVYDAEAYPVSPFYAFLGLHPLCHPVKCDGITKELLFFGGRLGALTLGLPERPRGDRAPDGAVTSAAETADGATSSGAEAPPPNAAVEAEWENKVSAVLRAIISSASTPVQALTARLLREDLDAALAERERMIELLRRRRERLHAVLERPEARAVFRADPFNSGFFALLNLRSGSAEEVALRALREHRVGVVPMESRELGVNALRLTFGSVPEEQLERLVEALVASAVPPREGA